MLIFVNLKSPDDVWFDVGGLPALPELLPGRQAHFLTLLSRIFLLLLLLQPGGFSDLARPLPLFLHPSPFFLKKL